MRIFIFIFIVLSTRLWASSGTHLCNFMPKNKMYIPVSSEFMNSEITEEVFHQILDHVELVYKPIFKKKKLKLKITRKWNDGTVNAYANRGLFGTANITMFGGLARHKHITKDGFALVACHELGHHIGGAPKYNSGGSWASNEGQSDYFGSIKCVRHLWEKDNNIEIVSKMNVDPHAAQECESQFSSAEQRALCKRSAMAGYSLGLLLGGGSFNTPSTEVVVQTYDKHPKSQCRLDTYFQASLCEMDHHSDVSDIDHNQGVCSIKQGHKKGYRPLCWYKPPIVELFPLTAFDSE